MEKHYEKLCDQVNQVFEVLWSQVSSDYGYCTLKSFNGLQAPYVYRFAYGFTVKWEDRDQDGLEVVYIIRQSNRPQNFPPITSNGRANLLIPDQIRYALGRGVEILKQYCQENFHTELDTTMVQEGIDKVLLGEVL